MNKELFDILEEISKICDSALYYFLAIFLNKN